MSYGPDELDLALSVEMLLIDEAERLFSRARRDKNDIGYFERVLKTVVCIKEHVDPDPEDDDGGLVYIAGAGPKFYGVLRQSPSVMQASLNANPGCSYLADTLYLEALLLPEKNPIVTFGSLFNMDCPDSPVFEKYFSPFAYLTR